MAARHEAAIETPRTPPNLHAHPAGLGINDTPTITTDHDYDVRKGISESPGKSPMVSTEQLGYMSAGLSPSMAFGTREERLGIHDAASTLRIRQMDSESDGTDSMPSMQQPFNFVPQQYVAGSRSTPGKSEVLGKRRGHKYRHSSVHASAMDAIMLPPTPSRAPLALPGSLPIPTRKEVWFSMTREQTLRFAWSLCHLAVSAFVQFSGANSLAMTALSRLLLFDAAGAIVCVVVDVMGNFEVWQRSSIRHPFGLERADVLAGFGMAVFIGFMGLDIISHGVQHSLENLGTHVAHSAHAHARVTTSSVDLALILAIGSTLVSAMILKNHSRIGHAMHFGLTAGWGRIFGNPAHLLTLLCSVTLAVLPFLNMQTYKAVDLGLSLIIALLMIAFGVRLGSSLASILLMSYKGRGKAAQRAIREVTSIIERDPTVSAVVEARFWQVHYKLCMANLKLRYRTGFSAGESDIGRSRQLQVESLIRQHLASTGGMRWEITTELVVEKDRSHWMYAQGSKI